MGIELAPLMAKTDAGYAGGLEKCVDFFQRNSLNANQIAIALQNEHTEAILHANHKHVMSNLFMLYYDCYSF